MVTVSKKNISEWLLLDVYSEMHIAKEKIRLLNQKYNKTFPEFEKSIDQGKENFEQYDDYIEWKAYTHILKSAQDKLSDIRNGNVKVS